VLPHRSAVAIDAVGVNTESPKLRPLIVTDPPDVTPAFCTLLMLTQGAGARIQKRQLHAPAALLRSLRRSSELLSNVQWTTHFWQIGSILRCEMVLNRCTERVV
jgi:hypothetical protein